MDKEKMAAYQSKRKAIRECRTRSVDAPRRLSCGMSGASARKPKDLWQTPSWVEVGAHGTTGGIAIFWDANEILLKKIGGRNRVTPVMTQFNQLIEDLSLIELALTEAQFTWSNGGSNLILAKLDQFFISRDWFDMHQNTAGRILLRVASYHRPILLETNLELWGPPPFRFEEGWFLEEGFKSKMKE
ncbi:hypothetical protein H6P81_006732 [Aristolochia fimbriata]|uniref:Uncharacterized protein n=1 Tax=Aristolochia fimbriata TaxID=158543 RepID=A0AAV7F2N6_ARIFI|nr:hypothetical protein H6P81_006732 [Aristolochia fimbriata]